MRYAVSMQPRCVCAVDWLNGDNQLFVFQLPDEPFVLVTFCRLLDEAHQVIHQDVQASTPSPCMSSIRSAKRSAYSYSAVMLPPGAQALPHHIVKVRGVREGFYVGRGDFWLSFLSVGNAVDAVFADYVGDTSSLSPHAATFLPVRLAHSIAS